MSSIARWAVVLVCVLGPAAARPALAEEARSFALTNVRIVPVVGTPIDRGTVVVVDGLIRDVGAAVQVPPGVARIDGGGRTVYPGLFDALGQVGLPAAAGPPARGTSALASTSARGPEDRPASTPWEEAADALRVDDARIETWRSGGFTTLMAAAGSGLLPGQV